MGVEWRVKATELANCNCAYGCPCQFNALPTHGDCRAAVAWQMEEGQFGAVRLDGLRTVMLVSWPVPCMKVTARCRSSSMSAPILLSAMP